MAGWQASRLSVQSRVAYAARHKGVVTAYGERYSRTDEAH